MGLADLCPGGVAEPFGENGNQVSGGPKFERDIHKLPICRISKRLLFLRDGQSRDAIYIQLPLETQARCFLKMRDVAKNGRL